MIFRLSAVLFAAFLMLNCAHKRLVAPGGAAVMGAHERVQVGVSKAETQRNDVLRYNDVTRTNLARIDAKEALIQRYHDYRAKHPRPPSPEP